MQSLIVQYVFLILIILALVMLADKIKVAYPIVLVLGGLALSLIDGFSRITIDPDLIFFIFLPPLLYEAAWKVSWKEFWKWRRIITGFAFPIVILTSCVIAFFSSWLIPGFTLAMGFLLGGIISPPDAISATTIMRRVKVPKAMMSIAEGESLLNDASSLIVFRFALAAVITGQFHFRGAILESFLVVFVGIIIGLFVAIIFYAIHRFLPTTSDIEIVLTVVTPFCMYYAAEHFHFSGVLAVVSGGLFLSSRRDTLLSYRSRIQAVNVWNSLVFIFNGVIFMLIGLQMPSITRGLGDISLGSAIWYGLSVSFLLIVTRLFCTLGVSRLTILMSRFITVAQSNPGWRNPLIFGWAGMRGVVSLAAALSIPLLAGENQPFPYRNLILFITFIVILMTLVFQGLTLPWVVRKVGTDKFNVISEERQELILQKKMALVSLEFLEEKYAGEFERNKYLNNLHERLLLDKTFFDQKLADSEHPPENSLKNFQAAYLEMLNEQRKILDKINRSSEFDEDLIRKYQSLIDIEEHKIREKQLPEAET